VKDNKVESILLSYLPVIDGMTFIVICLSSNRYHSKMINDMT